MNDEQLLRYSRHIMLPQIGIEGQQKLLNSTILIIGLGGLGSASSLYLAASGIGHIIIADFDKVEISNLQRQIIHNTDDIDDYKINSAYKKLKKINSQIKITKIKKINSKNLAELLPKVDVVLDGTDNFKTRFLINKFCYKYKVPLVSTAVIRFEGQIAVFKSYKENNPCYQCLYPFDDYADETCSENGILAPVAGFLGTMQAIQTTKLILNLGEVLVSKLMLIDALNLSFRTVKINKDVDCPICNR